MMRITLLGAGLALLLVGAVAALAQNPGPPGSGVTTVGTGASSQALPMLQSTALEASHVFRTTPANLYSLGVVNTGTGGFILLIDGSTVPANGALTSCGTANSTGCLKACYPINTGTASVPTYGGLQFQPGPPLSFVNGVVAVLSTTGCNTQTLGGTTAFFEVQVY
jgi:hypothetical protein